MLEKVTKFIHEPCVSRYHRQGMVREILDVGSESYLILFLRFLFAILHDFDLPYFSTSCLLPQIY